jgi:5-hydroxyisourate hydrolase-like protein (transthyretin family)
LWQALDYIRTFSFAVPQRNGVLTGQVINAANGEPVGEVDVTLRAFQDNTEILNMTTQANAEGRYTFEKLPTDHATLYGVTAEYEGIEYVSDEPAVFTPDSAETTLDLKVYETTTSNETVSVGQMHYIFAFLPDVMSVAQIFILNNTGNATYVGQNGQTFTFTLPDNATNIEFQESFPGSRFMATDTGYADTAPVLPNTETIIAVQYNVPVDDDTVTLNTPLPADINAVSVMLSDQGAELTSEKLQFMDTRSMQGQSYQIYGGSNLNQGETLSMQLSNLDDLDFGNVMGAPPGASVPTGEPVDQTMIMWAVIALGGLAIVLAGVVYPLTRPQLADAPDSGYNDPEMQRQKLLLTLARLDEAFDAGEIDEAVYRQARARAKANLARLMESAP